VTEIILSPKGSQSNARQESKCLKLF